MPLPFGERERDGLASGSVNGSASSGGGDGLETSCDAREVRSKAGVVRVNGGGSIVKDVDEASEDEDGSEGVDGCVGERGGDGNGVIWMDL